MKKQEKTEKIDSRSLAKEVVTLSISIDRQSTKIGFIGLGVMGHSMASHLLEAGYNLHIYNRTREKGKDLLEKGAVWEDTVKDIAKNCDVIITIVGFPQDVEQIYFGEDGLIGNVHEGACLIDMTTSSPATAARIYEEASARNVFSLDAPVSGGDRGAREATLSIMVGGDRGVFDAVKPLFEVMGKNIVFQGMVGSGQHTKMANQIAIAAGMIAVSEAIAYSRRAGLDPDTVLESISSGAAGSWSLSNLGPRMIKGDFAPGFYVKHFIKDMNIASEEADKMELDTPGLDLARSLYLRLKDMGFENDGTQALYRLFEEEDQDRN